MARKIWGMLSPAQRRTTLWIVGMMLVGMVLETLSTGAILPALALMQGDVAARHPRIATVLAHLGNPSRERLVVDGMLVLVGLYLVKSVFLGFLAWQQARLVAVLKSDLMVRLFAGYLRQPYAFHLQRNSAQLVTYVGNVGGLAAVLQVGLSLATEILILFGIAMLLVVVEPVGAILVVSILGLAGWSFHRLTRKRIFSWGEAVFAHDRMYMQHLQQGLGGAKDVKILGREDDFVAQFRLHAVGSAEAARNQTTLVALPRLWLELLAVVGLAGLVIVMIGQGKPAEALLPTAGLFAAAAFRFMPSFNRVLAGVQSVRYLLPVIDVIYEEIRIADRGSAPRRGESLPFRKSLTLDTVTFQYPATESPALSHITLTIPRGTSAGFIGRSGAGKSTLVDVMLGLFTPGSGTVLVDGVDIQTNLRGWQDQIGYVPQAIYLTDDTLRRNVAFGLSDDQIDDAAVLRAISAAQLEEFVAALPDGLETMVGERGVRLSGGQRQRIGIARALYHDPQVLVLDEATSALDNATERGVMESVRALQGGKTILIVAHRHTTVEQCDRLFHLDHGKLVEKGKPATVSEKNQSPVEAV